MKKPIFVITMIPVNLVVIFVLVEQLSISPKYAWRAVGIVAGISLVMALAIILAKKFNKPNKPS